MASSFGVKLLDFNLDILYNRSICRNLAFADSELKNALSLQKFKILVAILLIDDVCTHALQNDVYIACAYPRQFRDFFMASVV